MTPIQIAGYDGYILQEYHLPQVGSSLESLCASEFTSQPAISAYPDREVYRLPILSDADESALYVKRYRITTFKQQLHLLFHTHKAQKSLRIANILLKKGIPTPRPVAYFWRRTTGLQGERILLTEGIQGASLRDYVRQHLAAPTYMTHDRTLLSEKRQFIRCVAEFLATLHRVGVYHGDLTAGNIFIERRNDETDIFRVYLIDLDSVRSTWWIIARRRIKNLDELGRNFLDLRVFSTTDRLRFLKHYFTHYAKERRTFRQLFCDVLQRTQQRLKKHQQQFIDSGRA